MEKKGKIAGTVCVGLDKQTEKRAENAFFCPLLLGREGCFGGILGKSDKKNARGTFFLEKMKKIRQGHKKIEKNLDNTLVKCYNMLYCR